MKQTLTLFKLSAVAGLALFAATDVYAVSVTSGSDQDALLKGAVRYRNLGSNGMGMGMNSNPKEIYIGKVPITTVGNRAEGDVTGGLGKNIAFNYNPTTQILSTTVGTVTVSRNVGALDTLNYILLNVQNNSTSGGGMMGGTSTPITVALNNVKLNGIDLTPASFVGAANGAKWNITGEDLSQGFTLTGTIALTGSQPMNDNNHIEISVGYTDQTGPKIDGIGVNPNPVIINGSTTLRATVADADTGNNKITSAEYSLNGGAWELLSAQDGAFDSVSEDVNAELAATQLGSNEVCVRGTDVKGNVTTPPTCSTFMVTYQFKGFAAPLNNELINTAKAGQVVPAKWRLTDANSQPIEDATSFKGFYSYPINCENAEHSPHDAVEEYAPGNSGLQYSGNGEWQYNWKTPKSYWGTCRAMYLEFNSGAISPITQFQFK
ncbi:MAG: PxKF domain-containing protein [Methylobacter sp.]|nr:PxKF domain-containing protein [Methylobacter sp.]